MCFVQYNFPHHTGMIPVMSWDSSYCFAYVELSSCHIHVPKSILIAKIIVFSPNVTLVETLLFTVFCLFSGLWLFKKSWKDFLWDSECLHTCVDFLCKLYYGLLRLSLKEWISIFSFYCMRTDFIIFYVFTLI